MALRHVTPGIAAPFIEGLASCASGGGCGAASTKLLSPANARRRRLLLMAHPVIGNSLFAIVLALMHVPPMFALLWAQRRLRIGMNASTAPKPSADRVPHALPSTASLIARRSGD